MAISGISTGDQEVVRGTHHNALSVSYLLFISFNIKRCLNDGHRSQALGIQDFDLPPEYDLKGEAETSMSDMVGMSMSLISKDEVSAIDSTYGPKQFGSGTMCSRGSRIVTMSIRTQPFVSSTSRVNRYEHSCFMLWYKEGKCRKDVVLGSGTFLS